MLGNREIIKVICLIALSLVTGMFSAVYAQDPGNPDSMIVGNLDGTPFLASLNTQITIPVYLKTDDSIAFMHLPIATNDSFIVSRDGGFLYEPLSLWDDVSFLAPNPGSPAAGLTSQGILGFAFLFPPEDPQNYLYTNYQWQHIADFYMTTTDDISVLGDTTYTMEGLNPANGDLLMGLPDGITVVIPQTIWGGIYFPPNNPPVYSEPSPGTFPINEQFGICMDVSATDSDDDPMVMTVDFGPTNYTFAELVNVPGEISYQFCWAPQSGMTGTYPLTFTVNDGNGGVIDLDIIFEVSPSQLVIQDGTALPGSNVSLPVTLDNQGISSQVGAFEILVGWNPEAVSLNGVVQAGRTGSFEYFHVTPDGGGDGTARIVGIADLSFGDVTPPMQPDTGAIFFLDFSVSNDEGLIGVDLPIQFINLDQTDNTVSDSTGYQLVHPQQTNGTIHVIGPGDVLTGDINLNGVAYEVGDIVLFINHILYPSTFPFNSIQIQASDINADGITESIADLVLLMNIVNGTVSPPRIEPFDGTLQVVLAGSGDGVNVKAAGNAGIGGMLMKLSHNPDDNLEIVSNCDFAVRLSDADGVATVLAYMPEGGGIVTGSNDLFTIRGLNDNFEIMDISAADPRGSLLDVVSKIEAPLPQDYELNQNYPNPFNASTKIAFALPEAQQVSLDIYNISGQKVRTLINGRLDAGRYDVVWNSVGDDGSTVASGVYFYKLNTESHNLTRKMSLIK